MELELGLKITRTREDVSSSVDFRFSKDPFGPLVLSRETDSRFIIIIHIKGFKKEGIEIDINEEGNRITIRGRKPVEEIVLIRWMAWRKEVELRTFRKVFLIPDIVDLDKIKARFDDDDATLTITMPKRVKGISGFKLEEEEEESVDFGDVSETQNEEEVEEDNVEREEYDEESEIQRDEKFGDIMDDKERESQAFEGEEKGFSGDLDEEATQIEDADLEKIQQIDEQDKILEVAEEETVGQQEWADSNTESQDSNLKKLPDITEQENNQEAMEKQVETKSEGTESKAVEEIEEQKPNEQGKGGTTEKKTTSDDGDSLSKVHGIEEEPEKHSEEPKIQDMVEGKGEEEKTKVVKKKVKNGDAKEDVNAYMIEKASRERQEVEEENVEREESVKDSEIQREEEFGKKMEDKGRESAVFESKEEGFSGEETHIEDDDLKQVDDQDKILEFPEEETVGQQELADSNTETEDSSLKNLPDIIEQENNEVVMEQKVSQVETKSDDIGSRAVEEIKEEEEHDALDRTRKSRAMEKKTTDGNDYGLRNAQGIEEPERHNEESMIQEMVKEETVGQEKKETTEIKNKDAEEEFDGNMGEGFTPNIERTRVVAEDDIAETETKAEEFKSEKPEADEVDKKHELVEKKEEEEENTTVRKKTEDRSLIKLQESEEQHSKGKKRQDKQEDITDLLEDKTPEAETNTANGQRELADSNTESGGSSLRKVPDIIEEEDNQEVVQKQVSQVETKSDANGSRAVEDIAEQEPDALDRTSKTREMENKTTDGDDDGLRKVQGIEEPERHNEERKIQEMIDEETGSQENKNIVTMDAKEEFDGKMGEGFTPNIGRKRVVSEDDIAETETKSEEFESEKREADQVGKKHELVEKKIEEEENANVRKSEDRSLTKLQENEDQHSKERKRQDKQENIKELVEENPKAESNTVSDFSKPVQEIEAPDVDTLGKTDDEGIEAKEKKKSVKMEIENGDAKEEVDAKMDVPNIVETETKPAEFESAVLEADEEDKIHELVEKEREEEEEKNAKGGTRGEISLITPQDIKEEHSQGHKRHDKHEKSKALVEKQAPEAETNIRNDTPKKVQERCEGKQKIKEIFQEETKKQPEEHRDKMVETGKKIKDAGSRKSQEIIRQQELDESERYEKESNPQESVKSIPNDEEKEEKEISETETKEQESYRPKILGEPEKVHKLAEEKTDLLKNGKIKEEEEIAEKKRDLGDDDISSKAGDSQQRISDAKEEIDAEMVEGFTPNIAETETKAEEFEPHKLEPVEVDGTHELDEKKEGEEDNAKVRRQCEDKSFIELQENEKQHSKGQNRQEKTAETETSIPKPVETSLGKTSNEGKEGKEKKKSVTMEKKNGNPKEEIDAKTGKGFAPNIAETETRPEKFEPQKLEPDEVDEIHELVEKKKEEEDNAKVRRQSEDSSLVKKLQETEEQQFQGQERHNKQDKVKELLEEKTPAAETNIANQIPKPVQVIKEPEVDTLVTCGEKKIAETEVKEQESYRPKTPGEPEKIQELAEEKTDFLKNGEVNGEEEIVEKKTEFGVDDEGHISKKVGDIEKRDSDSKEEVDVGMGEGFTPNIAETETKSAEFESDKVKEDELDKIHELVEKKKKEEEEENDKVRRLHEQNFQGPNEHNKQEKIQELVEEKPEPETYTASEKSKPVQETEKPEVDTLEKCEDREFSEMETKEQDSFRPKILEGEDKIQELDEEKKNVSRKVEGGEEIAEKTTELGEDDIEKRGSDAMKGQEEKDKSRDLALEEKENDGGKRIATEAIEENDESRKVQETDEQRPHEEDKRGNQFQKLIGGETSGHEEAEDVENEKKTTDADKRVRDRGREAQEIVRTDSDVSGKYGRGDTFREIQENRTTYQNEQEEDKKSEADRPQKVTGAIEQELVNLNSQVDQDNVEDGEETRDPVEDKTNDCKEEESATKSSDVVGKVEGIKEQELIEPKRDHVSKIKEVVEEKMAESEIEAEFDGLSKVHGTEEQELHQPNIHKERDKTKINGTEVPSGQEKEDEEIEKIVESMTITEKENSKNAQEIREEQPDKPESHEKQYKVHEPVETGHNSHKEEQKDEKLIVKENGETEEDSSKKVHESDGMKRSTVQDKKQEAEEKEITRAMKEKEIVERKKIEDRSLRKVQDDEDPELTKTYKRQEDKIQEPPETRTSGYRKKVKKEDGNDTLRSQDGKPNLDEFERHSEQRNIPQLVDEERMENIAKPEGGLQDDDLAKFHEFEERKSYEDWIREKREKTKDLVKEEATDPKDKHTGEAGHNDHKEEQQEETVITKAELKAEEDSSEKIQEIEKQKSDELQRSLVRDKMQEPEEKDKTRAMEENEIVEGRTKTEDGSLRKVPEGVEDPQLGRHKTYEEEDRIPELVEPDTSDHRKKVKKKDGDDILRSQETGKLDLGELERQRKQRKIHQPVQDEKVEGTMENISEPRGKMEGEEIRGKFHESQKQKSYEDWREEESEEIEDVVTEEATDPKDKHTGGKGEHEERHQKIPHAKTKAEDEVNKKVGDNKKEEENLVDDCTTMIQETEKEESHKSEIHEKLDIVQDFVEEETGDQGDKRAEEAAVLVANNEKDSSKKLHSRVGEELKQQDEHKEHEEIPKTSDPKVKESDGERVSEKETKEKEAHVQQLEGKQENFKDDNVEARRGEKGKQGKTVEAKSDDGIVKKIDELERRGTSNHEVELVTVDDSLRKGQELFENESPNVSKRGPVEQEKTQQLKDVEKREDEAKSKAATKTNAGKSRKLEMQELGELEENEELKKIRKPIEEKTNAPEKEKGKEGNEKIAEVEMQGKIDVRMKDHDTKRQEPYELLLEDEWHGKIPEPIVEGTKYQREKEKRMADRETEEMKRKSEDVSSRKVQKIKAEESDGLEKHRKLSAIQENQSLEEKIQEKIQEDEEMNEGGGYKAVLKTKSMEDSSQSQDVEEKGSDQTKRYAEEEKIQKLMVEEEGKEDYDIRGEQNEKEKRIPQVESKANDDSSKKNKKEKRIPQVESKSSDDNSKKNEKEKRVESKANDDSSKKNEKEKRIPQVDLKANDDSSKKNEMEKRTLQVESNDDSSKKKEKEKIIPQVNSKANDDTSKNNESGRLSGKKQNDDHQELVELEKSDQRREEKKEKIVGKGETTDHEYKIHELEEGKSDKLERHEEEERCGSLTKEETSNDKEENRGNRGNRAGAERKIRDVGFEEEELAIVVRHREQDKKQSIVEKDTTGQAKENKNHETKSRDDSSRKTHENEKQESQQQKGNNEEQDKKNQGSKFCRNEEDGKEDKQIAEEEGQRKLKGIEERESTKMVERHGNQDNINGLVEENMNNQEGDDKKSMSLEVLAKSEDHESEGTERLRKQDSSRELVQQRLRDSLEDEETAKTETKSKDNESRKIHQIKEKETGEGERHKDQGRIKELVEDRTHYCRERENRETEFEDDSSQKTPEIDKEKLTERGRDEKRDEIEEPVDRETSEDDEEELEVEVEDSEEDWEAEVIQEMDSDEDNDNIRKIRRIKLGFRLVGGSTLFMSLIVIVISFIRSKRKIRCYKF